MANRRIATKLNNILRSRLASLALLLLPGFMFLGVLAPGAVVMNVEGEEPAVAPIAFRNFPITRKPMLAPGQTAQGVADALASVQEALVSGANLIEQGARKALDVASFRSAEGDGEIVLDEENAEATVEAILTDVAADSLEVDLGPVWIGSLYDIIPHSLRSNGEKAYDDLAGDTLIVLAPAPQPVNIPEPATGALLALGLVALSLRARGRA